MFNLLAILKVIADLISAFSRWRLRERQARYGKFEHDSIILGKLEKAIRARQKLELARANRVCPDNLESDSQRLCDHRSNKDKYQRD